MIEQITNGVSPATADSTSKMMLKINSKRIENIIVINFKWLT